MDDVTLTDQAVTRLSQWIEDAGLQPGDELPPVAELAASMSVSVPVVREAVRTLAAREILTTGQGRRARVASPSARVLSQLVGHRLRRRSLDLHELMVVRELLETEAARLAAERVRGGWGRLDEIEGALLDMETGTGERDPFIAADIRFHQGIADAAGNGMLALLVEALGGVLADARRRTWDARERTVGDHASTLAAHRLIAAEISAGRPAAAAAAMRAHFIDIAADVAAGA